MSLALSWNGRGDVDIPPPGMEEEAWAWLLLGQERGHGRGPLLELKARYGLGPILEVEWRCGIGFLKELESRPVLRSPRAARGGGGLPPP